MTTGAVDDAAHPHLLRFAKGPTVADRADALTALMAARALARSSKTAEFDSGLARLVEATQSPAEAGERLLALAQLVRLSQTVKPRAAMIRASVAQALAAPLPPVALLRNGDDRAYVAHACRWTDADWVIGYAAQGLVNEETAEKARSAFVAVLFSRASSLTGVFSSVREPLSQWKPGTGEPAESLARRLIRIAAAIKGELSKSRVAPGAKPGEALSELIRQPIEAVGFPADPKLRMSLAREVLQLTHLVVRSRFSLATEPSAYAAARVVRRMFGSGGWPRQLQDDLEELTETMLEAILLLAKQGIAAESVARQLTQIVDNDARTGLLLGEIANSNPDIPETVRAWLRRDTGRDSAIDQTRLEASQELRADPAAAEVLLETRRLEEARQLLRSSLVPALSVLDPAQVPPVESLDARIEGLARSVSELALVRRLMIVGTTGTQMPFQPKYFEVVGGVSKEQVRVIRPAVARVASDGSPGDAVLKGLVE